MACPICDAMHGTARDYVLRVLCDPQHRGANAEAITDALGFCSAHVAFIADFDEHALPISAVLQQALAATSALFDARPGAEDQLRDILFAAPDACPACGFAERRLAGLLARHAALVRSRRRQPSAMQPALCLPHFHALIGVSELADLPEWTAMEIAYLSAGKTALDAGGPGTLSAVTRSVAGRRPAPLAVLDSPGSDCRVCRAMSGARARWVTLVRESVRTDAAPQMVLPTCAEHIWLCHSSGDARVAAYATRNALEVSLRRLRREAARLEEEERRLERAKASVWYRAKSPAYILGQRRRAITEMPRCAACERMAVARDRVVAELLENPRGAKLCMKHFARAQVIAPAGKVRDALTDVQLAGLRTLERVLAEFPDKLWKEALCGLSGSL